ncbi:Mitochondrial cytochrome c oxidase subunit VIc/VIIs [Trinorchestia longiramus]|nr:Mitochondrial cytochrome c oxidase subunit VIc/VIIs [Trinorchestia longiramus]
MSLAKPQLRGLMATLTKRNIAISVVASLVAAAAWTVAVIQPRKQRYAEFYRTYDEEKSFERMRKTGLFQSCPLDD